MKVTYDTLRRGASYEINPGTTEYELLDGAVFTLRKPAYNVFKRTQDLGKDQSFETLWKQAQACSVAPENFHWAGDVPDDVVCPVLARMVEDFFMSAVGQFKRRSVV